jgi:hypothetical protein
MLTPDRLRPSSRSHVVLCPAHNHEGASGVAVSGIQTSTRSPALSPRKPGGATPTIVNDVVFSRKVRPTAAGSRPNRRVQKASLSTATASPGGVRSSERSSVLPAAAATPNVGK